MIYRRSGLLVLVTLLAIACQPVAQGLDASPTATAIPASSIASPSPAPPTVVLPDGSFATPTPVTPDPVHATQEAALQATIASAHTTAVARATASPFSTAVPPIIQIGRPAIAATQRDGLSFSVRLPQDIYLAGEAGLAEITLRNDGPETLFFQDAHAALLDEQGHETDPWPWSPMTFPGRFRGNGLGGRLVPGGELTHTLRFQVPPADRAAGHTYALWVETQFSRALPGYPDGWDNVWLRIETGPIPVKVVAPSTAQQLTVDLQVDWKGWHLRVTDADGGVPPGSLWGEIEAVLPNGAMASSLQDTADGTWSGSWEGHRLTEGEGQIIVRAWVAAPRYAIASVIQTVPLNIDVADISRRLAAFEPPIRQTFDSLEAAQATIDVPIYRSSRLPVGTTFDTVTIETRFPDPTRRLNVRQTFRLPNNAWLELIQMVTKDSHDYTGWGQARYAPEAQPITLGETTGYVIRRFGWWALDWKLGDAGFELRAPVSALSVEELLSIAAGVSPSG